MQRRPTVQCVIEKRLYLCQGIKEIPNREYIVLFEPEESIRYYPICDDFGPMCMSSVLKFAAQLEDELCSSSTDIKLFYVVSNGRRALTNAVFMLGCFMILKLKMTVDQVSEKFSWLDPSVVEAYRDATYTKADFRLSLDDCWRGFMKGKSMGWVDNDHADTGVWGRIDQGEYDHYDDPLNGDLHVVVPGKFIAFKGPTDIGGGEFVDDDDGFRRFGPEYFVELLHHLGASVVVRLNEQCYNSTCLIESGISFHDLEFVDCSAPPSNIIKQFLRIADEASGLIAVHCKAGLGRTGTLIACYMMREYAFTAREAIAWLRIMRPGCVIGEQQKFLCELEELGVPPASPTGGSDDEGGEAGAGALVRAEVAAQVAHGTAFRGRRRVAASAATPGSSEEQQTADGSSAGNDE